MKEWDQFLLFLDQQQNGSPSQTWASHCLVDRFDAQNLYLKFDDIFSLNFFKEHIHPQLKNFRNSNQHLIKVHAFLENKEIQSKKGTSQTEVSFPFPDTGDASFENFFVEQENEFVIQLLKHLKSGNDLYNPLFLYGAKFSGKSHLLKAACNHYTKLGYRCVYVDAETFSEHVVYAMKNSCMTEFRACYRKLDILFFDNVQVLAGKTATQEEFFHTFNTLHMDARTIVLSSEAPASLLKNIEPRLISRFEWGLSCELNPLSPKSYPQFLEQELQRLQINISKEHKETLLNSFSNDLSQLSSALHAIVLRSHLDHDPEFKNTAETLQDLKLQKKDLTPDIITDECAKFFQIKSKDIKGPSQTRPLAHPRQITMYLIRKHLNMPYKKIGEFFKRDHSTVMASITMIEEKLKKNDEACLNALKRIEWELKQ